MAGSHQPLNANSPLEEARSSYLRLVGVLGLATPANIAPLAQHVANAANADKLTEGLCELSQANSRLDTQANFELLIRYCEFIARFIEIPAPEAFQKIIRDINKEVDERRMAFLMGIHPRVGANSVVQFFRDPNLGDVSNLFKEIDHHFPQIPPQQPVLQPAASSVSAAASDSSHQALGSPHLHPKVL